MSSENTTVHRVGPAEPADAVAILRAGIREDHQAVAAIVQAVDPIQLSMHLAYLADLFGKRWAGGAEELDEALAAWQRGGSMDRPT